MTHGIHAHLVVDETADVEFRRRVLDGSLGDRDRTTALFRLLEGGPADRRTVREAAERAAVTDADFLGWARRRLLDESLPSRSRLINLIGFSSDGRFVGQIANIGPDAARTVFEIGRRDPDLRIRAMAWDILYFGQADSDFVAREVVPVALDDLRGSPNERARAGAARILSVYKDAAGVREALERAQSDASIIVRRAALGEGGGPVSAE